MIVICGLPLKKCLCCFQTIEYSVALLIKSKEEGKYLFLTPDLSKENRSPRALHSASVGLYLNSGKCLDPFLIHVKPRDVSTSSFTPYSILSPAQYQPY